MPLSDLLFYGVGDFRYQRGRYIRVVHFFERGDDFARGHTFGVQRQNLAVHLRNTRLALLNQLRFKGIFTVTRRVQLNLAVIAKQGQKELLGMWLAENEVAKFWLSVLTELKNQGLQDILIACVDGLKGFPDAINSVYPQTHIQLCIIHMVRNSLKYVSRKDYKAITSGLKAVYQAPTEEAALMALDAFADAWDNKYPQISKSWRTHWENLNTLFSYPPDIRKAIYTTNAIESLNSVIRARLRNAKCSRRTTRCGRLFIWRSKMRQKNGVCRSRTGGWR